MVRSPFDNSMYNRKVHTTFGTYSKHYLRKIGSKWTFRGKKEKHHENWYQALFFLIKKDLLLSIAHLIHICTMFCQYPKCKYHGPTFCFYWIFWKCISFMLPWIPTHTHLFLMLHEISLCIKDPITLYHYHCKLP